MWKAFLAFLASLTADPAAIDRETPRATAAVAAAYATFATGEADPQPAPKPTPDGKCKSCNGRGYIIHGDGHRTDCPNCQTLERMNCPDGKCPLPSKTVLR